MHESLIIKLSGKNTRNVIPRFRPDETSQACVYPTAALKNVRCVFCNDAILDVQIKAINLTYHSMGLRSLNESAQGRCDRAWESPQPRTSNLITREKTHTMHTNICKPSHQLGDEIQPGITVYVGKDNQV